MLDLSGDPGLAHEAPAVRLVAGELGAQDLQRDHRAVRLVHGPEDDADPALAEELLEPVRAQAVRRLRAGPRRARRSWGENSVSRHNALGGVRGRATPRIGTVFAGYRIESLLGRGGMSVVYRAEHPRLGRTVALKLLSPELAEDESFRERFVRESRLRPSLDHPNIIPIYDAGEADGRALHRDALRRRAPT